MSADRLSREDAKTEQASGASQAAEKPFETVILSEAKNLALCIFKKIRRARSFATLRMTTVERFSAAC